MRTLQILLALGPYVASFFRFDDVDRINRAELGAGQHVDTLFERFARVPLAAASLRPAHHPSPSAFT